MIEPEEDQFYQTKEDIAYHESGHAVVTHALDQKFVSVSIRQTKKSNGRVKTACKCCAREDFMDAIIILWGGWAGVHHLHGYEDVTLRGLAGAAGDLDKVQRILDLLQVPETDRPEYIRVTMQGALDIVGSRWPAVEALAQALLTTKGKFIPGDRAKEIIDSALLSLATIA